MNIRLLSLIIALFLQQATATVWAQTAKLSPYIYRIEVRTQYGSDTEAPSLLTGFKVTGYAGIVTALHGLVVKMGTGQPPDIMAFSYRNGTTESLKTYTNLVIDKIDIEKDLAFLRSDDLTKDNGLTLLKTYTAREYEPVYVYGYPESKALDGVSGQIQSPANPLLGDLVMGEYRIKVGNDFINLRKYFERRGSPALTDKVFKLSAGAVKKAHSGGPVMNERYQVIGVANGGYYNSENDKMNTWAISEVDLSKMKEYDKGKTLKKLLQFTNSKALMSSIGSEDQTELQPRNLARNYQKAFGFRKETPSFLLGVLLSRPVNPTRSGITLDTDWGNLNAFLDIYADVKLTNHVMLGGYVSSSYLQYKVVRRFGNGLPLEPDGLNSSTKQYFDRFGLQMTLIPIRGILHHIYLGAGGFYRGNNDSLTNYRFFVGYRQYLWHRKNVALDFRLIRTTQYETALRPSLLGNSQLTVQPLTGYYLCAGINFALFRRP